MLSWKNLTWDIKKKALGYLMFLKRKQSGKMKAKGCVDGRPQRQYITKEKSSSPTVLLYALIGSCFMDNEQKESDNRQHSWCISTRQLATRCTPWVHHVQRNHGGHDI